MLNRQIARLRLLGVLFCLAGGASIAVGWAGTAQVACVDCQIPYLLSGGAAGVVLTIVGVGLLLLAQIRLEGTRIAERIGAVPNGLGDAGKLAGERQSLATSAGDGDGWTAPATAHTPK